jgi:OmpA-OmpF porin, OOP family
MRCLAAVAIATTALGAGRASANVEVGGTAGLHTFSQDSDLGVVKGMDGEPVPGATSLKNSALFGLRLGVFFNKNMGVEIEGGAIPTEPRSVLFDVWMIAARGQFVYQLRPDKPLVPFVLAGAGIIQIVDVGARQNESIVEKEMEIAPYLGIGAKYLTQGAWGVRADLRGLLSPKLGGGVVPEVEALVSIYRDFGRKAPAKKEEPPPPPLDEDPDKDGIIGAADQCPDDPEDMDGFQDADGCPDPDNDGDGILDAADQCPMEAEDKDGFQDEDGCPDPDNDGDGIPDTADKCPTEPETKNGFQDEDGCPDEIPETLKQFTGVIQGINFQVNAATLQAGSNRVLDKAIAVLQEFKEVRLEIQGHTDDQPLRAGGKFPDNTSLSQARAETVKQYFVSKGIDESRLTAKGYGDSQPVQDPAGLKGAQLNQARAKNRRVEFKLIQAEGEAAAPAPAPSEPTP